MKIMIVDRDGLTAQRVHSKLEALGHQVTEQGSKNDAVEQIANQGYDLVFVDPSPVTTPRPLILSIRRAAPHYPYIILMSESLTHEDALRSSANDFLSKPLGGEALDKKVANAERFTQVVKHIGDDSEDFPSAGGVIAKSAFNQLFLSAIERADRYGENSYMLQITIDNYKDILALDGPYGADFAVAKLSQKLVYERRQSDIIGQTGKNQYCLLLLRPSSKDEPIEAANRFGEALGKATDISSSGDADVQMRVTLIDLPSGDLLVEHKIGNAATTPG